MVLSDRDIRSELAANRLRIEPLDDSNVQPASVDLRLGHQFLTFEGHTMPLIDVKQDMHYLMSPVEIDEDHPFVLEPRQFVLAVTLEYVELPDDLVGRLDGKSSLGRLGLVVHSTAGFVDPGWKGNLTLELSNLAPHPIRLYYGMRASQISFIRLSSPAEQPYGSKALRSRYQGQRGPTASRFYRDFATGSPAPAATDAIRRRRTAKTELWRWLAASEFEGDVGRFAEHLGVKRKTVENWVYGRTRPSLRFRSRVHEATTLPQYRVDQLALSDSEPSSP